MADDSPAPKDAPPSAVDAEYDAILATIVASERGRWFLDEYARRHRGADTEAVLAAVARLEAAVRAQRGDGALPALPESVRHDLTAAATAVSRARQVRGYGASAAAASDAETALSGLLDEIDWRLHNLFDALFPAEQAGVNRAEPAPAQTAAAQFGLDDLTCGGEAAAPESAASPPAESGIDALADLTATPRATESERVADAEASEAAVTDWAFAAAEPEPPAPPPRPAIDWAAAAASANSEFSRAKAEPVNQASRHLSALEQIEAREYARREEVAPPPELRIDDVVGRPERLDRAPIRTALDQLIAAPPAPPAANEDEPLPSSAGAATNAELLADTAQAAEPAAEPMFAADLLESGGEPAAAANEPPSSDNPDSAADDALGALLDRGDTGADEASAIPPPPPEAAAPGSEVAERLEHMRKSIAALMEEIAQKTGRPIEPPRS